LAVCPSCRTVLGRALYAGVELDEGIPPERFKAAAEVIGFVVRQRGTLPPLEDQAGGGPPVQ